MLQSPVINVKDEQCDRNDREDGRARYISTKDMKLEYLESDTGQLWTTRTGASIEAWLGGLAAILNLSGSGVLQWNPPMTREKLLQTG